MKKYLVLGALCLLLACTSSGPQKTLNSMAKAMEENNSQAFLAQIDMDAYAASFLKSMTKNNEALNSINVLGQMLGLGNIDQLVNGIIDVKAKLVNDFSRGVASGELMAQCAKATTPDCPWVPQSLREAQVKEVGPNAAIAKVTTPERLTCWLALQNISGKWFVVGRAVLEDDAKKLALAEKTAQATPQKKQPAKSANGGVSI